MLVGDGQFFPEGGHYSPIGETIFPEGRHCSLVNFVLGGQNSPVNKVLETKITSEKRPEGHSVGEQSTL